jgi:serum/glucocorticoid-regulated kinase 2
MTDKSSIQGNWDLLKLEHNEAAKKLISSKGKKDEKILYSNIDTKINRKNKSQSRTLLITNLAIYNLKPGDFKTLKRRILIENVGAITVSLKSNEFVVHIPEEYDYRYESEHRDVIVDIIAHEFTKKTRRRLAIIAIKTEKLHEVTLTRDQAIYQSREDVLVRKKQLILTDKAEYDEDAGGAHQLEISSSSDKVNLDSFEPLKVLGRGAFGKVIQVKKKDTGKIYAMKILKKTMVFAKKQVDHTKAEREVLSAFQHPFLMGLKFAFQTTERLYLVMEFFRGGELFFHLRKMKRFTEEQARLFVAEVALALGHLHSLGFIYRDLKPENILMDDDGHLCLTDFGLAKHLNPNESTHSFVGTPEYLAPEMIEGTGHSMSVDWWCLGIFLYELTVGVTPFYSGNVDEMYHKIVNAKIKFPPRISDECKDLISKLLIRDPKLRLGASAQDVEAIKSHRFFAGLDWAKLLRKEIEPQYRPAIDNSDPTSTLNFHSMKDALENTYIAPGDIAKMGNDAKFDAWTFNANESESKLSKGKGK